MKGTETRQWKGKMRKKKKTENRNTFTHRGHEKLFFRFEKTAKTEGHCNKYFARKQPSLMFSSPNVFVQNLFFYVCKSENHSILTIIIHLPFNNSNFCRKKKKTNERKQNEMDFFRFTESMWKGSFVFDIVHIIHKIGNKLPEKESVEK